MSLRPALQFIAAIRSRPDLAARLTALGPEATLDEIASIATESGFAVTADDLRRAHPHDWAMRWILYGPA